MGKFDRYVPVIKGDQDADGREHDLARMLNTLLEHSLFRARVITDVELASGANRIAHGLGRKALFVVGTAYTAGVVITDDRNTTDHDDKLVSVRASGATNATLIVG